MRTFAHATAVVAIGLASVAFMARPASAVTIVSSGPSFTLDGVTLNDGGTITGSFDLNGVTLSNVDLSVTDQNLPDQPLSFTDNTSDLFCTDCSPSKGYEFRFFNDTSLADYSLYLDLYSAPVNGPNALIPDLTNADNASDLDYNLNGVDPIIGVSAGSLDATGVPEPAALTLLASGLVGFGVLRRRKRA